MRKYYLIILSILNILLFSCSDKTISEEQKIKNIMLQQQQSWNNGNIEGFMEYYWKDDSLRFIGRNGIKYGWNTTLKNYKKSYPDKATMGKLSFTFEDVKVFTATDAYVFGRWNLEREEKEDIGGYFSLLWRNVQGKWVIVSDHTS